MLYLINIRDIQCTPHKLQSVVVVGYLTGNTIWWHALVIDLRTIGNRIDEPHNKVEFCRIPEKITVTEVTYRRRSYRQI